MARFRGGANRRVEPFTAGHAGLIQLGELDQLAGGTSRDEREMARILAAWPMGDSHGTVRDARHLLDLR